MNDIRYVVKEVEKPVVVGLQDHGMIRAWEVTRIEGNFGWHIGNYTEKIAADTVAQVLAGLAEYEV